MKLRFEVDQAAAFRAGIDCPHSIVTVMVDPKDLPQEVRDLIADRLEGIDVCQLSEARTKLITPPAFSESGKWQPQYIIAKAPTFDALMEAVRQNEADTKKPASAAA